MKRTWLLAGWIGFAVAASLAAATDGECYTIVVGRAVSSDGTVLVAHNEDDRGPLLVNVHKLPPRTFPAGTRVQLNTGASLERGPDAPGLLWLEVPGQDFADAYVSERGVVITSNSCPSREDRDDLSEGGIGYMLRRLVAERAHSAAEGVRIAARLIETYGYSGSGRTYTIADPREAWLLGVVRGRHWVARRVPDDGVAVLANRFTIDAVDLADTANCLGPADLVAYATARGWYDPGRDGAFRFERAYSAPENRALPGNVLRQWRGTALLSGRAWREGDDLPFAFAPSRKLGVADLLPLLRDHYEGTVHDASDNYRQGSPNRSGTRTICTDSTQYAFVAQLRAQVAPALQGLVWICFRRPDSNAFSPWYASIPAPPDGYELRPADDPLTDHFKPGWEELLQRRDLPFPAFARLSEKVDERYAERIAETRKQWRFYEQSQFDRWRSQEREFAQMLKTQPAVAVHLLGNAVAENEFRKWLLAERLLSQFEP